MKQKDFDAKMRDMDRDMSLESRGADMNRARSVAVGTSEFELCLQRLCCFGLSLRTLLGA